MSTLPTFFLSHGGGPWPWLDGPLRSQFDRLQDSLENVLPSLPQAPRAILVVTAHWETRHFTVSSANAPAMLYDYNGFPEHTYQIRYEALGEPTLAARVAELLSSAGHRCDEDPERGFDHGTFSVMQVMRPQADIPVVQLSIRQDYDVETHLTAGAALAPLRDEGVLIIGSGFTFHDLSAMGSAGAAPSAAFDAWLQRTLVGTASAEREAQLLAWEQAPSARRAHPRADHLVPLFTAVGAAGEDIGRCVYSEADFLGHISASSYAFG